MDQPGLTDEDRAGLNRAMGEICHVLAHAFVTEEEWRKLDGILAELKSLTRGE